MNNYIITNHAKQRRPHHIPKTDEELLAIMDRLNAYYKFDELENGKYYFRKKGKAAVFKKDGDAITLITMRGINLTSELNNETLSVLKLEDPEREDKRQSRKAMRDKKNKWMQYYPAVFEEASNGGYSLFFPDVPGCISAGKDLEEAIAMAKKDIAIHLTGMINDGGPLPKINLDRCKEAAKGHILVMIRPQKELLMIKGQS